MTTFINQITEEIIALRPNLSIETRKVFKNNDIEKNGINIIDKNISTPDGYVISPIIYLDDYYADYECGNMSINEAVSRILRVYDYHKNENKFEVNSFLNYEWVKSRLAIDIIGPANVKRLEDIPTISYLNLHIGVRVFITKDENGSSSICIRNEHLKAWGITIEEAVNQALLNDSKDCVVQSLEDVFISMLKRDGMPLDMINEILPEGNSIPMYVVTNQEKSYGAKNIYTHIGLRIVADMFNKDLYVIPSSVHELLCLPYDEDIEPSELVDMIKQVNQTEVSPDEILSDTLYFYSKEYDEVSIVDCQANEEVTFYA